MLLLGLDTATPAVTVALHDGGQPLAQLVTVDAHRHAELLAPAVAKVIADAGASQRDLTGIVVGVGPGPYTGLRVGLVTARVLGAALGEVPASAAKVAAADAAYRASRVGLQVHGAIGYTREFDLGLWITRVRALVGAWGTPSYHRTRVLEGLL